MRLIDADALRQVLEVYSEKDSLPYRWKIVRNKGESAMKDDVISRQAAIEATKNMFEMQVLDDWYCADGERKEQNDE